MKREDKGTASRRRRRNEKVKRNWNGEGEERRLRRSEAKVTRK